MNTPILEFSHVSFGYHPEHPILQDLSFKIYSGRVTAIMGPNGVGKSTLIKMVLGWLSPCGGNIYLEGRPIHNFPRRERSRLLSLVPQSEHTPFDYSVLDYVLMGRAPHLHPLGLPGMVDTQAALLAIEQVGLMNLVNTPVPQLSGGEHQLMLLARAIVQGARMLLLDEPTSHLDLHNKARILQLMRELRARGITLLMTNHEPDVVLALADDILLMDMHRVPQFGALEQILTTENLSRVYGLPVRLVEVDGHKQVIWT